jgi:hypothetical protein
MNTLFIAVGVGAVGAALAGLAWWLRGGQSADLGSVSHTWIAELKSSDPYDPPR